MSEAEEQIYSHSAGSHAAEAQAASARRPRIAVLGGGAWGTALAGLLAAKRAKQAKAEAARANAEAAAAEPITAQAAIEGIAMPHAEHEAAELMLYCRSAEAAGIINATRQNSRYLPNIILPRGLWATADVGIALQGAEIVLSVFPAQETRAALQMAAPYMPPQAALVLCSKGIERSSEQFISRVARDIFPDNPLAVLSGPSFAADVARGLPTAVTLAAETEEQAACLAGALSTADFRCYATNDMIGVELGGALKNVLALGAGMVAGRGLGASARAAFITRGFAEMRRMAAAFGGRPETMGGLAVLGDLILTCSSAQSRNYAYGLALGKGEDTANLALAEGVATAPVAAAMCAKKGIDAPLINMVAAVLAEHISLDEAVRHLLARPLKFED